MNNILNTLAVGFCILAIFYIVNKLRNRKLVNEPPLVYYKYPIIGHTWDYCADVDKFLLKCKQEYGEIFSIYVYGSVITVVGKELCYEVFNSRDVSFSAAFEEKVPVARILGLPLDYMSFAAEISKNVFTAQMHLFLEKTQQSLYSGVNEIIGECDEPKIIHDLRQVLFSIVSRPVTTILVGDSLCHDNDLINIFMNFSNELYKLLKVPESLGLIHPWIFQQSLIMRFRFGRCKIKKLQEIVIEKIKPEIEERLRQERKFGNNWKPPVDCIQYLLSQPGVDKENPDYVWISGYLLAITFASMSTTVSSTTNFLLDFASRPEYWDDLLEEQEKFNPNDKLTDLDQISKMEKLDSFLKEALRLTGNVCNLIHRVTGSELKFSNGYQLPRGSNVGIYLKNVHYDDERYGPDPNKFDGYRYLGKESPTSKVSRDFLHFGMGRHACPGRIFAINEIKMLSSILIKKYKITTKSKKRPSNFIISGVSFPNPEPLIFEKRVKA
ncbi:sterol 14-demethylase [Rhizophagus irregularis DAOM 197198w]|uniref:Sterol 14-demethylase n=1 Tax=Rhizophagus irregularis (strain DAOM 197198w) TaxID=1432141 RepID=A0A015K7L8_RHIIW|nr:sterol 14-demethylase [Rhizophagus irregularis DAOM 197198w]